jgi:tetratricopeptide (TPR) repeat protein
MTRPVRNWLLVLTLVVAAFVVSPRLPDVVTWTSAAVGAPLFFLALWLTAPFHRARTMMGKKNYDGAAAELAAFETALTASGWKRLLAGFAVGMHTTNALAASRNTLGAVRLEQGRLDDARTHFKAALEHDAGYGVPWGNLAVLAAMSKDAAGAEEARQKAAERGFKPKLLAKVIKDKLSS